MDDYGGSGYQNSFPAVRLCKASQRTWKTSVTLPQSRNPTNCAQTKKKPFSEEHHLSKSWLIRLPMMIVPWNKTIFHGVSKHYSPRNWGRSDSGHGQILHHGIDLGFSPEIAGACQFSGCLKVLGGLEAKIIGGKPAKYAHPVLGNPTLEVILSNPNHDGKSLTMYIIVKLLISTDLPIHRPSTKTDEVTTRLLPPCAKRAKASLRRSP